MSYGVFRPRPRTANRIARRPPVLPAAADLSPVQLSGTLSGTGSYSGTLLPPAIYEDDAGQLHINSDLLDWAYEDAAGQLHVITEDSGGVASEGPAGQLFIDSEGLGGPQTFQKSLASSLALVGGIPKRVNGIRSAPEPLVAATARQAGASRPASLTLVAAAPRRMQVIRAASQSLAAAVSTTKVSLRTYFATLTSAAVLSRQVLVSRFATSTLTAGLSRQTSFPRTLFALQASLAALSRNVSKPVAATRALTAVVNALKVFPRSYAAALTASAITRTSPAKSLASVLPTVAVVRMSVLRRLFATPTLTAITTRSVGKFVAAVLSLTANLATQYQQGSQQQQKSLAAVLALAAAMSPRTGKSLPYNLTVAPVVTRVARVAEVVSPGVVPVVTKRISTANRTVLALIGYREAARTNNLLPDAVISQTNLVGTLPDQPGPEDDWFTCP